MEKVEYELFYLVGESKEAELPTIREEVEKIVKQFGGEFLSAETSEKRTLAYAVRKEKRGTYIARRFTIAARGDEPFVEVKGDPKDHPIVAMTKQLQLFSDIFRFFILRADELPELAPIAREEYPTAPRKAIRDRRQGPSFPRPSVSTPAVKAPEKKPAEVVTVVEPVAVPVAPVAEEKPVKAPKEEKKDMSKEELDKKLDEVLSGIE
jgi:ribosomal protein S6